MSRADYVVSCPYCRRQYRMKLDREEVTLKKTRATCGRCGNSFELAPRITVPGAVALAPPPPPMRRPITSSMRTVSASGTIGGSDPAPSPPAGDEVDIPTDFSEAPTTAAPSPVGPTAASSADMDILDRAVAAAAEALDAPVETTPLERPFKQPAPAADPQGASPAEREPTAAQASRSTANMNAASASASAAESSTAIPKSATTVRAQSSSTTVRAQSSSAVPAQPVPQKPPKSWLQLADPGLDGLREQPSEASLALEHLL